jgi:hypothetical protein
VSMMRGRDEPENHPPPPSFICCRLQAQLPLAVGAPVGVPVSCTTFICVRVFASFLAAGTSLLYPNCCAPVSYPSSLARDTLHTSLNVGTLYPFPFYCCGRPWILPPPPFISCRRPCILPVSYFSSSAVGDWGSLYPSFFSEDVDTPCGLYPPP